GALHRHGTAPAARVRRRPRTRANRRRRRPARNRGGDRGAREEHVRRARARIMSGGMDFGQLAAQAQKMQEELQRLQEEASGELVTASAGGGMVKVTATAGGEITQIEIDPKAIDPSDPELLADLVTAAVNEALRSGRSLLESKLGSLLPGDLGGLLPGM